MSHDLYWLDSRGVFKVMPDDDKIPVKNFRLTVNNHLMDIGRREFTIEFETDEYRYVYHKWEGEEATCQKSDL